MDISGIEYREDEKEMEIQHLMSVYKNLDWLMCRTILMHTEEELGELIEKRKNLPKQDISRNMVVKSVKINDE
tara:strand:+ start:540 stop:758 length:219 start_codon:yes stop_codon:yes gene_type:complete